VSLDGPAHLDPETAQAVVDEFRSVATERPPDHPPAGRLDLVDEVVALSQLRVLDNRASSGTVLRAPRAAAKLTSTSAVTESAAAAATSHRGDGERNGLSSGAA
jgi:hypothetical protein